ncbi:MAG: radical SAM family heme chaperone HemW [Gemmatimonadota bacterium]
MQPRHIYVHVPFCARRCSYCDFAVEAVRRPPVDVWLDAVEREAARRIGSGARARGERARVDAAGGVGEGGSAGEAGVEGVAVRAGEADASAGVGGAGGDGSLETVYVGGGTPSLLGPGAMAALRERLERHVGGLAGVVEWTAEANPESFDETLARDWLEAGVTRVSLGLQTFHEPALRWMGRLHGAEGAARAVEAARSAGLDDISIDLIFGLPERLRRSWRDDLERALALEPDHVSLYGLTAEPGTPLGRWVATGRERLPDEERYGAEYLEAVERMTAAGLRHYEVSNFARPGRESRHNRAYWSGAAYLGLGPGAHSYQPPERRWNVRGFADYATALAEGREPVEERERVEGESARLERVWLGLRTDAGLPASSVARRQRASALVDRWREAGWARPDADAVRLTARGWLLLDRLAVELDHALASDRVDAGSDAASHSRVDQSLKRGRGAS